MKCMRIVVLFVLLQSIGLALGQFNFNYDYPDYSIFQSQEQQDITDPPQPQFINNDNNRRPGSRPRPRPSLGSGTRTTPATTTTARPLQATRCLQTCPVTSEYNPVCGTDGLSYNNRNVLRCNQACGIDVSLVRMGPCAPRPL